MEMEDEFLKNALVWFWSLCCLLIIGCGNDTTFTWGGRYGGQLVAFVDDSLAILQNSRGWEECTEVFMGSDDCEAGGDHTGLFLVNYRKKEAPLWGDTIDDKISLVLGFYVNSLSLFSNAKNEYGFWKIGEKPRVVRKWKCDASCLCNQGKYARPWLDGNILLKMTDQENCPYAVLDTSTGEVQKLEFTGGYAWLEGCDDITYRNGSVICLKRDSENLCEMDFLKNGVIADSLDDENCLGYSPLFYGTYILFQVREKGDRVVKLDGDGFIYDEFPELWIKYNTFIDSTGSSVYYASEDLFVVK
jgi:hypothetical protein